MKNVRIDKEKDKEGENGRWIGVIKGLYSVK